MAAQKNRPVPKPRSFHLQTKKNNEFSTTQLYDSSQDVLTRTLTGNSGAPTILMLCGVCSKQFDCGKSCKECDMQFCMACDEHWHCDKMKGNHIRTSLPVNQDEAEEQSCKVISSLKIRPTPKPRSIHHGTKKNNEFSTTKTLTGQSGLPCCVQHKRYVPADQENRDSQLRLLLCQLDEACIKYRLDYEKARLAIANSCIQAASSPKKKYRILEFFQLLENNKNDVSKLLIVLFVLEKYAINLLCDEKPQHWREIKLNASAIKDLVLPVHGALDVLKQMGYTQETGKALTFPINVQHPNIERTVVLTADLIIARHETNALIDQRHPFLDFNPSGFVGILVGNMRGSCSVCHEQNSAKNCEECDMQFCLVCDERWHCHKLKKNHVRTSVLANKDEAKEQRSSLANTGSLGSMSAEERRWSAIGICLNKILAPNLKNAINIELQNWYNLLSRPPIEINNQDFIKHQITLPPSKFPLQYKNINGNDMRNSPLAYDYAVKDHLSLAKLFVQEMDVAPITGFNETMDLVVALTLMVVASPFVHCGAAVHANYLRYIKNEWAHGDFSIWTKAKFDNAMKEIQLLVESTNLSEAVKKEVSDELQHRKNKESHESWKWKKVSLTYHETFKRLIKHGRTQPDEIIEINGVRVCLDKMFLIGKGGQCTGVYIALGRDGIEKAVKVFFKPTHGHLAQEEKELLIKCKGKELAHVVRYWFLDDTSHSMFAFLIMDLCEETLESFVHRNSRDDLVKRAPDIIRQLLKGLADLHRTPDCILHRDLKPSNILRNIHDKWLLADFGIGRILPDDDTTHLSMERGTKKWRAVESCSESGTSDDGKVRYKKKSDIQVTGMVAFYILTEGKHPFGEAEQQILTNLPAANPVNLNMLDDHPLAKDLISWMLNHDPKCRPSAEEALQHPYLKSKEQQFNLLCGMGNEPHVKKNDVNSDVVKELGEDKSDWRTRVDSDVLNYLSFDKLKKKLFKYTSSWTDCLRLIRNIKEHWNDYPRIEPEATKVNDPQDFFLKLFPDLVLVVFKIARSRDDLKELSALKDYFKKQ